MVIGCELEPFGQSMPLCSTGGSWLLRTHHRLTTPGKRMGTSLAQELPLRGRRKQLGGAGFSPPGVIDRWLCWLREVEIHPGHPAVVQLEGPDHMGRLSLAEG